MATIAYHLVAETWFRHQPEDEPYLPQAFSLDGFVHLTHGEDEVIAVGNRYYTADPSPYLLLTIDLDRVTSDVRYDDPECRYPHVYGPIDREAIVAVREAHRDPMGLFLAIAGRPPNDGPIPIAREALPRAEELVVPTVTAPATLLLTAWDDLDWAIADVAPADMLRQIDGGSCFAWTLAHVTYEVDSWINRRFQHLPLDPVLSDPRFGIGRDGGADDWPAIRDAIAGVRDRLRPFLLGLDEADLDRTIPYDGTYAPFRERGINLRAAILQAVIHHVFHLGEIVAKRELMGYGTGSFPGSFGAALMGTPYRR